MLARTQSFLPTDLVIDVAHGLGDVACRGHRVGLVVGAVDTDPAAFTAHDHGLVLSEACDVRRNDRPARTFESPFLGCLDPLRQDQRVIREIGELAGLWTGRSDW
jgi:hypothetical protein